MPVRDTRVEGDNGRGTGWTGVDTGGLSHMVIVVFGPVCVHEGNFLGTVTS